MLRNFALAAALLVVLSACESNPFQRKPDHPPIQTLADEQKQAAGGAPNATTGTTLQLSESQRFKEVPLPNNVKEDLERSYVYESQSLQIGRMVYTSRASITDLADFYAKQCPAAGWKLDRVLQAEKSAELFFSQPGKHLVVTVRAGANPVKGRVLILDLTPESASDVK